MLKQGIIGSAVLSVNEMYRYVLTRSWDAGDKTVMFIGLNPSTADADVDDATIRRCIGFAKSWGYNKLVMTNLYAFRATDPGRLLKLKISVLDAENESHISRQAAAADKIICAWGNHPAALLAAPMMRKFLELQGFALSYLALTKDGQPRHPLRLPKTLTPQSWARALV